MKCSQSKQTPPLQKNKEKISLKKAFLFSLFSSNRFCAVGLIMSDGDKKLEQEIAKIKADYDKKIAAVLDISSDPALEVWEKKKREAEKKSVCLKAHNPHNSTVCL